MKKGEAIATIDDSSLQTKKSQLVSNNWWNEKQLIQLNAQLGALERQIAAESQLMERAVMAATEDLNRIQREYIESDLTKGVIVAPTDGSIVKINLRNSGQQVQRGAIPQES